MLVTNPNTGNFPQQFTNITSKDVKCTGNQ